MLKNFKNVVKEKVFHIFNTDYVVNNNHEYSEYAIGIGNLTKSFKKFVAVDNATISVPKGTIHGFIGPNGSDKTTTIKCLVSAMLVTKGDLLIYGKNAWSVAAKKHIGYIPEAAKFPRRVSTYEYLVSMDEISGLTHKEAKVKTEEVLKNLDLWKFKKRSPNEYSSGMKKKVLLAQSLLNNPDVLILDEPAANLDPTARTELFNDLRKLRKQGKTIFISSHILSELQNLADEITILNYSKVVYRGQINHSETKYEISCNDKLQIALEEDQFSVEKTGKTLLITINCQEDINKILKIALDNNVNINLLKPYIVDLQTMYERIVMEANQKKKGE
ncbi:ABC transporter ATP-binding protein [Spiroplasma endosymbiont of Thecophora atra]|uniref:ABC transporter ATP-binding protein n=1 Tax=Spiroplasma endosymbiont of Thecophora atra TaxID=3066294 RepID=UPI0030CE816B